jgi:hypothetical protein
MIGESMRRFIFGTLLALVTLPAWAGDCTKHNAKIGMIKTYNKQYGLQEARFDLIRPKPTAGDAALCAAAWKLRNALERDLIDSAECADSQGDAINKMFQAMSTLAGAYHCPPQ